MGAARRYREQWLPEDTGGPEGQLSTGGGEAVDDLPYVDALDEAVDAAETWPEWHCECGTHNDGHEWHCVYCGRVRDDADGLS